MYTSNHMTAISDAFGLSFVYNMICKAISWVNADKEACIKAIFNSLNAIFDPGWQSQIPLNGNKFALVFYLRSESWKLIDNKLNSLEMVASDSIKESINDWKKQIKTIREKYLTLQRDYTLYKKHEKTFYDYMAQPNLPAAFKAEMMTASDEILQQRELRKNLLYYNLEQSNKTVESLKAELLNLQKGLWESILSADEKCSFSFEEQEKYTELVNLLTTKQTHFQVAFEVPDQLTLDEAKLAHACFTPSTTNKSITEKDVEAMAEKALEKTAVKLVAIYRGNALAVQEKQGFTIYYRVENFKTLAGNETPQIGIKTIDAKPQIQKTRYKCEIEALNDTVLNLIKENLQPIIKAEGDRIVQRDT